VRFSKVFLGKRKVLLLFALAFLAVLPASLQAQAAQEQAAHDQAERIMRALAAAYPNKIGAPEFRGGDWAFRLRGRWFYYADGRILPEELRARAASYSPLRFNQNYPLDLPSWESTSADRAERTRRMEERAAAGGQQQPAAVRLPRPQYFFEELWDIRSREQAFARQAQISFLGRSVTIHSDLVGTMRSIETIILNEASVNPVVRQWVNSLESVAGWNWRNIRTSNNRSLHSYGIAIDILPRDLGGLATYWAWETSRTPQWWNIPYSRRWHPPNEVIRAFESFGFVWGGKWTSFDTMHFEYRPEVFILSNIPLERGLE